MGSFLLLCAILVFAFVRKVSGITEGEVLSALKKNMNDPNSALRNWDSAVVNPCTWFGVQCDGGSVTRIDLGNAGLLGELVAELGELRNLQQL
ncbi:hypothetical protein K1719_046377 [Acacia pycnantha]|nr:hypothetical protein K1719_046377 [Acacia pycnantha]